MTNNVLTADSYQKDDTFDKILRAVNFSISLIGTLGYGLEKAWRIPAVISDAPEELESMMETPLNQALKVISIASYAVTAAAFFDPLFREQSTFLWFEFKSDTQKTRRTVSIIIFSIAGIAALGSYVMFRQRIKNFKKSWQMPISIVSNALVFAYGLFQIIILVQNWEQYKNQRLFAISSIIVNLSAPVEIVGVDKRIYKAEKRGIAYGAVYGARVLAKGAQSVGLYLIMTNPS